MKYLRWWRGVAAFVVAALLCLPRGARAARPDLRQVQMHHPADTVMVVRALDGAHHKLTRPQCQQLLDDFRDADGRTLRENLESVGVESAEYLSLLRYGDGRDLASGRCRSGAAAVTRPRNRVAHICSDAFRAQTPGIRANTLIHEMLHSLGLGENPPSSQEINGQVRRRCGT